MLNDIIAKSFYFNENKKYFTHEDSSLECFQIIEKLLVLWNTQEKKFVIACCKLSCVNVLI